MDRKISDIIAEMTLEEKASLCSGGDFWHTQPIKRLDIPSLMMSDGPHGLRKQESGGDHLGINESIKAVCFPAACAAACSFDTELMEHFGSTLGEECQANNIDVLLGPAVNIKRSPLCGRNFEYFSEDPFLSGKMASAYIKGVQSWKVIACMKHFAANNQEYRRMTTSSEVDERTLREIYFPAFEISIKEAKPKGIMCSYNKINGVYAADNEWLLTKVLRNEWGFDGVVVTDWGAVNDRVKGIIAGLDIEMPSSGGVNDAKIVDAVKNGLLDEEKLNQTVKNILEAVFSQSKPARENAIYNLKQDHEKAIEYACDCAVLLENDGTLPLRKNQKVLYLGGFAEKPRYQGGGSSHINCSKIDTAIGSAKNKNRDVIYMEGFSTDGGELSENSIAEAIETSKKVDVTVIFAGLPEAKEGESYDREDMKLPDCQNKLIEEVAKVANKTVVVLHNGSPVECPWADKVSAVLELYLCGEGVGEVCDRILFGEVNPSGHLAESFPLKLEDNPSFLNFPGDGKTVNYAEAIYVGYRYYEAKKQPVRWAFGHGLSYTKFAYENLKLSQAELNDSDSIEISVDITNIGDCFGKEVVQLYVRDCNNTYGRPYKELKGFAKLALEPNETKTAKFYISARDLSYYACEIQDWYAPSGMYEILVGSASDDIKLTAKLNYETIKLLPLKIDGTTTLGELINDRRTAPVLNNILQAAFGDQATNSGMESEDATAQATMYAMPLKSLASFAAMSKEQYESMIDAFKSATEEY